MFSWVLSRGGGDAGGGKTGWHQWKVCQRHEDWGKAATLVRSTGLAPQWTSAQRCGSNCTLESPTAFCSSFAFQFSQKKQTKETNKQTNKMLLTVLATPGGHLSSLSQPYRYDGGRALSNYMQNLCQLIHVRIACLWHWGSRRPPGGAENPAGWEGLQDWVGNHGGSGACAWGGRRQVTLANSWSMEEAPPFTSNSCFISV